MSRNALVLRHIAFEDLGSFAEPLAAAGYHIHTLDPTVESLAGTNPSAPDLLIVLGGPIGAYEEAIYPFLTEELAFIGARLATRQPTLGLCLGAQLMARALGAKVAPMGQTEIGWSPLTLTPEGKASPLKALAGVPILHWHGDAFELPVGATPLASTTVCANQAFALGPTILGLQCHPEGWERGFERWLVGHAGELAKLSLNIAALRADAERFGPAATRAARAMLTDWLKALPAPDVSPDDLGAA